MLSGVSRAPRFALTAALLFARHGVREAVFEAHPAGYDDVYVWWETVHPRLADLPGVEPPGEDEDAWQYVTR